MCEELRIGICSCSDLYQGKLEGTYLVVKKWQWDLRTKNFTWSPEMEYDPTEIDLVIREIPIDGEKNRREQLEQTGCHLFLDSHEESEELLEVALARVPIRRKRIKRGRDYLDWVRKKPPSYKTVLDGAIRLIAVRD